MCNVTNTKVAIVLDVQKRTRENPSDTVTVYGRLLSETTGETGKEKQR